MPCSNTHFLEVSAHVSSKVATKSTFRGKKIQKFNIFKAIFLNQKRRISTKVFEVSLLNLTLLYLSQLQTF